MKPIELKTVCRASILALGSVVMGFAYCDGAQAAGTCEGAELIKPDTLVVAYNGDMPGTGTKDGKLTGIDGEIMTLVAEKLGLKVEPALMEWSAEIESVKSRRVDIMHGMMGWNKPRTEVIAITDPIYYAGALATQKIGSSVNTVDGLKGKRIATMQGFGWIPELKSINPDLALYDTSDAGVRDLLAGRIDVLFADPPLIQWLQKQNTSWQLQSLPMNSPYDAKLPSVTGKYEVAFGMSRQAPKLEKCINEAITEIWKTCGNVKVGAGYGFSDKFWYTAPAQNPRTGVDREASWTPPSAASCPQ